MVMTVAEGEGAPGEALAEGEAVGEPQTLVDGEGADEADEADETLADGESEPVASATVGAAAAPEGPVWPPASAHAAATAATTTSATTTASSAAGRRRARRCASRLPADGRDSR
jgi:hypothetical protein